jgi:hypothetical protein
MASTPHGHHDCRRAVRSLGQEASTGACVGAITGGLLTGVIDPSQMSVLLAVLGCGLAGSLFGILLWLGAASLPEEPIPPVRTPTHRRGG